MAKLTNWRSNFIINRSPRSDFKKSEILIISTPNGFEIQDNNNKKTLNIEMSAKELIDLTLELNKNLVPIYETKEKIKLCHYDHLAEFEIGFFSKYKNGEIDFVFYNENGKYCALSLDGKIIENII